MIARVNGVYADIYVWDNLVAAYRLAARGDVQTGQGGRRSLSIRSTAWYTPGP